MARHPEIIYLFVGVIVVAAVSAFVNVIDVFAHLFDCLPGAWCLSLDLSGARNLKL